MVVCQGLPLYQLHNIHNVENIKHLIQNFSFMSFLFISTYVCTYVIACSSGMLGPCVISLEMYSSTCLAINSKDTKSNSNQTSICSVCIG